MSPEKLHDLLVGAIPPLAEPPDRMARVRRRVARTRGLKVSASVLATVAVTGGAVLGAQALTTAAGSTGQNAGHGPGGTSVAPSVSVAPSTSPSPVPIPSLSPTTPSSGLGVNQCPQSLAVMSVGPGGEERTIPAPLRSVTVCRYRHAMFDMSNGSANLLAGPKQGTSAAFAGPIQHYLDNRARSLPATGGCQGPSPVNDISVDVVYAVDADGNPHDYAIMRITCSDGVYPPTADADQLVAAIDGLMGAPY